ncbi:P2 family phage major capsid protein, partial [Serratia ficaria]|uniref:P2 family phage major capsid protein n=1 Tax=Serratia ficaria TaxID=61651 RepID=UPI0021CA4F25
MKKQTRFKFNAYLTQVAKLNGIEVDDIGHKFSVEPSVTQTLMDTVQESSEFLTKINMVPVDELKGEKVGVGVNGSIASTTDGACQGSCRLSRFMRPVFPAPDSATLLPAGSSFAL